MHGACWFFTSWQDFIQAVSVSMHWICFILFFGCWWIPHNHLTSTSTIGLFFFRAWLSMGVISFPHKFSIPYAVFAYLHHRYSLANLTTVTLPSTCSPKHFQSTSMKVRQSHYIWAFQASFNSSIGFFTFKSCLDDFVLRPPPKFLVDITMSGWPNFELFSSRDIPIFPCILWWRFVQETI